MDTKEFNAYIKEFMLDEKRNNITFHRKTKEGFIVSLQKKSNCYTLSNDMVHGFYKIILQIQTVNMYCSSHDDSVHLYNEIIYDKQLKRKTKEEATNILFSLIRSDDKSIDSISTKIIELYSNLHFDKYISKYVNALEKNEDYYSSRLFEFEKKMDPKYFKNFECCVCYDNTKHKTSCGHHLCIICYETMFEKKTFNCPLCRDDLRDYTCEECGL
jgi:hypothetical protein